MSNYDIIYLISNTFGTYVIYRFMMVFFDQKKTEKVTEILSYTLYFMIIGVIYIKFDTPMINLMSNLILFFLLTFNYKTGLKRRILAVVYIYAIMISVEAVTLIIFNGLDINDIASGLDLELVFSLIMSKILSYIVVLVLSNLKMIRENIEISPLYWIAVFIVPISTFATTALFMLDRKEINFYQMLISIIALFVINIFVFYLYDRILISYNEKIENDLLSLQNKAFIKQLDMMERASSNLAILRHDFKIHLTSLQTLIDDKKYDEAAEYLRSIYGAVDISDRYARSGNTAVDSILNYMIQTADSMKIDVRLELKIPETMGFRSFDLAAMIGNLMENSIEAVTEMEDDRHIEARLIYDRKMLHIYIRNPYAGSLSKTEDRFKTTKEGEKEHGYGLTSIGKIVDKYNGKLEIDDSNNIFDVRIMLYDE